MKIIKKMQRRFIFLASGVVLLMLLILLVTINSYNYVSVAERSDQILQVLADNGGTFPERIDDSHIPQQQSESSYGIPSYHPHGLSSEVPFESRFFTVNLSREKAVTGLDLSHVYIINANQAKSYARRALKRDKSYGFIENYRYKRVTNSDGIQLIFLDCGRSLNNLRVFMVSSTEVSILGFIFVFIIILLLSKKMMAPLEESYLKQKRFISDAGHEMRTPLTIIDADLSVMEMDGITNEWTDDIKTQSNRLASLTNELIYLSKMEEGVEGNKMIDFPMSDVVSDIAGSFDSRAVVEGKHYDVDVEPGITLCGDEKAITKLISVLLDNAFKYSEKGGDVRIELVSRGTMHCALTVYNTAPGIKVDELPHMFDRFYRMDKSRNSSTGGYGIGLSIAKAVTEAHGGSIEASSSDGKSLTINVRL